MNFPLDAFTAVSAANPWTYVVFGCIGFAFGFTLEIGRLRRFAQARGAVLLHAN